MKYFKNKTLHLILYFFLVAFSSDVFANYLNLPPETYPDSSTSIISPLNGEWLFKIDSLNEGVNKEWYNGIESIAKKKQNVPGTWNIQDSNIIDQQGVVWYQKDFWFNSDLTFHKLKFEGVFRSAQIWLNGEKIGNIPIPYLPFSFDISEKVKLHGVNKLVVRIDNSIGEQTLPCNTKYHSGKHGWFPYGGITREVYISSGLPIYIAQAKINTDTNGSFNAILKMHGKNPSSWDSTAIKYKITDKAGIVIESGEQSLLRGQEVMNLNHNISKPELWDGNHPENVYQLIVEVNHKGKSELNAYDFAFRSFDIKAQKFYLNGENIFLKGINRHEDHPVYGPVLNEKVLAKDIELLDELGINFIRPGHYPNHIKVIKALEQSGILIAEEIPVYQLYNKQMGDSTLIALANEALERMIIRDYNRPAIVMWSLANEVLYWKKNAKSFIASLQNTAKKLNSERETMVARLTLPRTLDALFGDKSTSVADVVGVNIYKGWYFGSLDGIEKSLSKIHKKFPDMPMIVSEFGAGAVQGNHLDSDAGLNEKNKKHTYSEEFQVHLYKSYFNTIDQLDFVQGTMPWVFADFRMQWNPGTGKPHPVELTNLKGLVSGAREEKLVFNWLKTKYSKYQK